MSEITDVATMVVKRRRTTQQLLTALCLLSACLCIWQLSSTTSPLSFPTMPSSLPMQVSSAPQVAALVGPKPHILDASEYGTLIDLTDFKFDRLASPCPPDKPTPLLLALVHSAPAYALKRQTIRETWGSLGGDVQVVFLLGRVRDPALREKITEESDTYKDIIEGSFIDDYRNMTYKHVMGLKFALYHCPRVKYVLKTDDDMFVNTPTLRRFLSEVLPERGAKGLIMCPLFPHSHVKRSYRSKWRVSPIEFPGRLYPPYCSGWAILYAPDVVATLYREAQSASYFWIDDVHVTGTLAKRAGLTHTSADKYVLSNERLRRLLDDGEDSGEFLYGPPDLDEETILALWKATRRMTKA